MCSESHCANQPFPIYPNTAAGGYLIPEEWNWFRYDAAGNMVQAENRDGQVRRTYYPGGALATDTLRIAATSGAEFTEAYGLAYAYDGAGRMTGLQHPVQLAYGATTDGFAYDAVTGALSGATDRTGNVFTFRYDRLGRMTSTLMPGGVVDSMRYDLAGRLTARFTTTPAAAARLQDEQLTYDGRNKLVHVQSQATVNRGQSVYTQWYSGMGNLVATDWDNVGGPEWAREEYQVDPLGNMVFKRTLTPGPESIQNDYPEFKYLINAFRGHVNQVQRLPAPGMDPFLAPRDEAFRSYDLSGNQNYSREIVEESTNGSGKYVSRRSESRSYYDAGERLRAVQTYERRYTPESTFGSAAGIWEEYATTRWAAASW